MDKIVVFFSMMNLAALEIGSLFSPNAPLMWLAGTSLPYDVIRLIIIGLLAALLLTNPPRNFYLRLFVGLTAISVLSAVIVMTFGQDGMMPVLDSLTLAAASVAMGLMSLEISKDTEDDYVDIGALRHSKHHGAQAR